MTVDPQPPLLARLHALAGAQDGCVHVSQLAAAGISPATVRSLVKRGALTRVLVGVYVVGTPVLSHRQALRAALLRAGDRALLSHHTAASLDHWLPEQPGEVWLTAPGQRKEVVLQTLVPVRETGAAAQIRLLGSRRELRRYEVAGLPTTTPADTIVAVAGVASDANVALAAWREADYRNRLRADAVLQALGRGVAGSTLVRELMDAFPIVSDDETDVATWGEFLLLEAMVQLGLPRPLTNAALALPGRTYFPDFRFRARSWDQTVVVEVDGGVHKRATRKRADRARDAHMRQYGIDVLRVPDDDVQADALASARLVEARLLEVGGLRQAA